MSERIQMRLQMRALLEAIDNVIEAAGGTTFQLVNAVGALHPVKAEAEALLRANSKARAE